MPDSPAPTNSTSKCSTAPAGPPEGAFPFCNIAPPGPPASTPALETNKAQGDCATRSIKLPNETGTGDNGPAQGPGEEHRNEQERYSRARRVCARTGRGGQCERR